MLKIASHADVLTGSSRNHSSPTGRNPWRTPKNVCVGSYAKNCFRLTGYSVKVRSQVQTITRAILPRDQFTSVSNSQRGWSCKQIFDSSTTFLNPLVGTNSLYGKRTVGFSLSPHTPVGREARALRARKTLTARFTDFFTDFEKKKNRLFSSLMRRK